MGSSEKLHLDSGTLTPLLKRLDAKGLVQRSRCKDDERIRVLQLTDAGRELRSAATDIPSDMFCQTKMSMEELGTLKAICERLITSLA